MKIQHLTLSMSNLVETRRAKRGEEKTALQLEIRYPNPMGDDEAKSEQLLVCG